MVHPEKLPQRRWTVLKEGTDEDIHDPDTDDALRVDARGSSLAFHINDRLIDQITDPDYSSGELAFTSKSSTAPIHTSISIRWSFAIWIWHPSKETGDLLYQDDFTNPASSWPERKFDNYFIGYHEPEYYHVELVRPNYKTTVFEPRKEHSTMQPWKCRLSTASKKTSPTGDFRYGIAFRRSGDQYYAFTISPRTKKWYVLKSSPNKLKSSRRGQMRTFMTWTQR